MEESIQTPYDTRQLNEIIKHRRSIYPYQYIKGKQVPEEIVRQILENAIRAPNHKQTEPWRFKVFSGEGLKYFGDLQASLYNQFAGESFNEDRHRKMREYPLMSSHVISIGMRRDDTGKLPENEEIEAVACAVQNMFLSVTAYGLGSYWTSAGITYFEEAKPYFDLQRKDKLLGFFYIGYPAKTITGVSKRNPLEVSTEWISDNRDDLQELLARNETVAHTKSVKETMDVHEHTIDYENTSRWVVYLTVATMLLEIGVGYYANSMALTAEGWHMSTHVFAIGLTWLAYLFSRRYGQSGRHSFQQDKVLSLSGFTSAIVLQIIAIIMAIESIDRLIHPVPVKFSEAIIVAVIGLIVNAISARMLHQGNGHHDDNIRAAYIHVLADGLTSLTAIVTLGFGWYYNLYWLDAASGLIGAIVITSWAVQLIKNSGGKLIDYAKVLK
ncbi:cation diffusion facilitator family transporter [Mucilaginibacter rubeus]|uniref:Cation diffusion facilitator family transporter n=2 Tax=Mucilaginibacter rubeus TaxID=2027860 RepID=A0A5C1I8C6_9SPHI|nr:MULTISPECIES: cation diffusion facilitator family transporter [Mucilaginibacter]QEM06113.1 cation diffusion facilitator family transporter [Mucilaginibacter rubeus]QEM13630.1 cation diffusion facilitator family transporter [Mucilaginibacter rubeus]QEM18693.1 cation diffusion facilitator family transporter [Mucilaginibacter gossypii]QTE36312.1 cation diffusion facilitator family transporter [Mucilaginibacter gossypii]QTE44765.1 cation diffusion facilitator family transporter [Mucilaginibacte